MEQDLQDSVRVTHALQPSKPLSSGQLHRASQGQLRQLSSEQLRQVSGAYSYGSRGFGPVIP